MSLATALALALLLDGVFGEPEAIWRRVPHPAVLMGRAVDWADRRFNAGAHRRRNGALALAGLTLAALTLGRLITALPFGGLWEVLAAAILLAQKSLVQHVEAVARGLTESLAAGRHAVAQIVGRDTAEMETADIARAAIESAAENLSDGVVAPAFWFLLLGLPGMLAYKLVNTADSMIGHRTARHQAFGWAAARMDDALNWVPARLTAGLLALTGGRLRDWRQIAADARRHRSPNAGWPEAAMARCLDVALAGPRSYGGVRTPFAFVHADGKHAVSAVDITRAVDHLWRAWAALLLGVVALSLL